MQGLRKVFTAEDAVYNQFMYLRKIQDLLKKDADCVNELREDYNAAFASVLLFGYYAEVNGQNLVITGEKVGLDWTFFANANELSAINRHIQRLVQSIVNKEAEFGFKTNKEVEEEKAQALQKEKGIEIREELKEEVNEKITEDTMTLPEQKMEPEKEIKEEAKNEATVSQASKGLFIIEEDLEEDDKFAFGLTEESGMVAENFDTKPLSTMWFTKNRIVCQNRDITKGVGNKEFDFIVYPTQFPMESKKCIPVRCIVCIYSVEDNRYKVSFPKEGMATSVIDYEDYSFLVTARFTEDGKLKPQINLDTDKYEIVENDDTIINQNGQYIPKNIGKVIELGEDKIEFFPLYLSNNAKKGTVTCIYKHTAPGMDPVIDVETGTVVIPIENGKRNREISTYWTGENEFTKFAVTIA